MITKWCALTQHCHFHIFNERLYPVRHDTDVGRVHPVVRTENNFTVSTLVHMGYERTLE